MHKHILALVAAASLLAGTAVAQPGGDRSNTSVNVVPVVTTNPQLHQNVNPHTSVGNGNLNGNRTNTHFLNGNRNSALNGNRGSINGNRLNGLRGNSTGNGTSTSIPGANVLLTR